MKNRDESAVPKPHRTRFGSRRFGLGRFLFIVTVICIAFGWSYQHATKNVRATKFLENSDVHYRYFINQLNNPTKHPEIKAPNWQRKLLGDEYFLKIKVLGLSGQQASSAEFWLNLRKHQAALQDVEVINIRCGGEQVLDISMVTLKSLSSLNGIYVAEGMVSSKWLRQCGSLEALNCLRLESPANSPIDAEPLSQLNQTDAIILSDCGTSLQDAEFLRDRLRKTMIVVVENNDNNMFD